MGIVKSVSKRAEKGAAGWWRLFYARKGAAGMIEKIADFIFKNWRMLILIYAAGAAVTFSAVSLFALWIIRKERKESELYPDEYYLYEDTGGPAGLAAAFFIGLFIACISAVLWPGIPLVILAELFLEKVASRFPELMGNLTDDQEENKRAENE